MFQSKVSNGTQRSPFIAQGSAT
jgi:peptidoglycan hydrolase CwlO-like protein